MRSALVRLFHAHLFLEENLGLCAEHPEVVFPEAGDTFLDFKLLLELGKGAFAGVFLATEPRLGDRLVAVKIAYQGGAEAEVLGRIQHPNIVPIHSIQEDAATGLTAVCMPYVGGATLCDVRNKAFPAPAAQTGDNSGRGKKSSVPARSFGDASNTGAGIARRFLPGRRSLDWSVSG